MNSDDLLHLHPEGEVITLQADNPDEYGERPKEYKVRYRFGPRAFQFGDQGFTVQALLIVVTDLDA